MMQVKFWGVRGTTACSSPEYKEFGGHTSCVSIETQNRLIVVDAGTGLFDLGKWLEGQVYERANLLLSHVHMDHIAGLPFFRSAWNPNFRLDIYAAHLKKYGGVKSFLKDQYAPPFFPVSIDMMTADLSFHDFDCGAEIMLEQTVKIQTLPLNHPNGATGYRINSGDKSVCYISDTEHREGEIDLSIVNFIQGCDLLIYDATYTDEQYPAYKGWGHSTWQEGMRIAQLANVKKYAIFHHNPDHADEEMKKIERRAMGLWDHCFVARQGQALIL